MGIGMRMKELIAQRMRKGAGAEKFSKDSRQQSRKRGRVKAFAEVTAKFGFEPRKARRGIASTWARNAWKALKVAQQTT